MFYMVIWVYLVFPFPLLSVSVSMGTLTLIMDITKYPLMYDNKWFQLIVSVVNHSFYLNFEFKTEWQNFIKAFVYKLIFRNVKFTKINIYLQIRNGGGDTCYGKYSNINKLLELADICNLAVTYHFKKINYKIANY